MPTSNAPDFAQPLSGVAQQQKVSIAVGTALAATSDTLANRSDPSAAAGTFFYATDQFVLYLSTGASWVRIGDPAGATMPWYSTSAPDGWIAFDGSDLPGSTGIYADLFDHLGGLTTPDTRGRGLVFVGTNTDVSTLGNHDGLSVGSRSPKHNSTNNLTLPNHGHSGSTSGHWWTSDAGDNFGASGTGSLIESSTVSVTVGDPTSNPAISGSVGPGGSRPTDTPAFITFGLLIAKL